MTVTQYPAPPRLGLEFPHNSPISPKLLMFTKFFTATTFKGVIFGKRVEHFDNVLPYTIPAIKNGLKKFCNGRLSKPLVFKPRKWT